MTQTRTRHGDQCANEVSRLALSMDMPDPGEMGFHQRLDRVIRR